MPYESRWPLSPPSISVPSFIFTSPSATLPSNERIIIDCQHPEVQYFTLHSLREWSKRFAAGLVAAGLLQGDRVMLVSKNSFWSPVLILGVLMAGGIYTSGNPACTARELAYQFKDCEPRFIFVSKPCSDQVLEAATSLGFDHLRVFDFGRLPLIPADPRLVLRSQSDEIQEPAHQLQSWSSLIASPELGSKFEWETLSTPVLANRTAILVYSSGTTGLPKGVELTHYNLVTTTMQQMKMQLSDTSVVLRRSLCVLPIYHGLGLVYYVFVAPKSGVQTYMMERYDLHSMLSNVERFKITELLLVPPMVAAVAKDPSARHGKYDLSSIRKVIAGAAPLGLEITRQFEELWSGKLQVRQALGMSEFPVIAICWNEADSAGPSSTSVGELVPGISAKLIRPDGTEEIRRGHQGELWMRGPNAMKGYWRNDNATAETKTSDGWLKTGDIAYVDDDLKWYIVDRKKELIKVKGAQVAPAELEALLLEHSGIVDAAVIGIKTASLDEEPMAFVVPQKENNITEEDVAQFVASKVSRIKHLTGGVTFISSIPKTAAGKILRRELREQASRAKIANSSAKVHM